LNPAQRFPHHSAFGEKQASKKFPYPRPPSFLPACSALQSGAGGRKAFPQFLRQQEGKTEKFSFP